MGEGGASEVKVMVEQKPWFEWFVMVMELVLAAESKPPAEPVAGRVAKKSREVGRKDLIFVVEGVASLVSWRNNMCGLIESSSDKTSLHLSASPRPLTFQEQRFIVVVGILKTNTDTLRH